MSFNGRMGKQVMDYPHNGILFSHKKNALLVLATTWMNLKITLCCAKATNLKIKYTV